MSALRLRIIGYSTLSYKRLLVNSISNARCLSSLSACNTTLKKQTGKFSAKIIYIGNYTFLLNPVDQAVKR